jgi:uncharacterized protein YggE
VRRKTNLKVLFAMVAIALEATVAAQTLAAPPNGSPQDTRLAQLFYPPASDRQSIGVTGQGHARVPADLARMEVVLTNRNPQERGYPATAEAATAEPTKPQEPKPITEAALTDIIKALQAAGIPESKIKVTLNPIESNKFRYLSRNTAIAIELDKPTQTRVNQIVKVLNTAVSRQSDRTSIYLEDVYVQYVVNSCEAVEDAAYLAAMKDAKLRAGALAKSMGVQLADVPSVAELPFLGRFYSPCSQEPDIAGAIFRRPASPYNPETPAEVEVYREIAVTYRLR